MVVRNCSMEGRSVANSAEGPRRGLDRRGLENGIRGNRFNKYRDKLGAPRMRSEQPVVDHHEAWSTETKLATREKMLCLAKAFKIYL